MSSTPRLLSAENSVTPMSDSSVLMPASVFYPEAVAAMHRHHAGSYIIDGCGSKETSDVITELTEIFDVSRTAIRIRLKQAGMLRSMDVIVCD